MALYTFESPRSTDRIAGKIVVADSSYLISFTSQDSHSSSVDPFHKLSLQKNASFFINVVTRHEFIQKIRLGFLALAMQALANNDPAIAARYHSVRNLNYRPSDTQNQIIAKNVEKLFKHHVRSGDANILLSKLPVDIWNEAERLEKVADVEYFSLAGSSSWQDLGSLIASTGMACTDSMIVNFALDIAADAIVTADCDFAQVAHRIDVFMPEYVAVQCSAVYSRSLDHS